MAKKTQKRPAAKKTAAKKAAPKSAKSAPARIHAETPSTTAAIDPIREALSGLRDRPAFR